MQDPNPAATPLPPVSAVAGDVGRLLQLGLLEAPSRPGLLATLEHYQIVGELGRGGMGMVFKAIDSRDGSSVAIKLLRPELAELPQQVHRFLKEAGHMLRLKHPNILPVLHVSENSSTPFFVTPLMARGCLNKQLSESQPFEEGDAIAVARQIATALQHAHKRGVTHRDLKPGNVLLDEHGTAFLADFGLARTVVNDSVINPATEETGEGTAHYMSPQLARGEAEDTRCDIYAFGAMLYEMVSGRPPYEGSSTAQILAQIKQGTPVPITKLCPKLSPNFARIVEGAIAREHRDRYANMEDLATDLERFQAGLPTRGPRRAFPIRRLLIERRPQVIVGLAILSLLGLIYFLRGWIQPELRNITVSAPAAGVNRNHAVRVETAPDLSLLEEVVTPEVVSWASSQFGDWDGDGEFDVVNLTGDTLRIVSGQGQTHKHVKVESISTNPMRLGMMADIDGDGLGEAFIAWNDSTHAHLSAINQLGWPIREFQFAGNLAVHPEWGTNQTFLEPLRVCDLDGDGKSELLATVLSSWALRPRGICCYDLKSGSLKWFFETAAFVVQADICDLDRDGTMEVLVGSNSPNNGANLPDGTDDRHAYLYVLSANGDLRWRHELAGVYANVRPLVAFPTSPVVTVCVTANHEFSAQRGEHDTGEVLNFNHEGKLLAKHDFQIQLTDARIIRSRAGVPMRILVADRLATIHVLDEKLNPISSRQLFVPRFGGGADLRIRPGNNLKSAPAAPVVVCSTQLERLAPAAPGNSPAKSKDTIYHDNRITVLDANFNPTATHLIRDKWENNPGLVAEWRNTQAGRPPILLVLSDRIQYFALSKQPDN